MHIYIHICIFTTEYICDEIHTHTHTHTHTYIYGFPDSSVGKKSAYNAGDCGLIPGSERSAGEGIGYPLQYSWASLVAQLIKSLSAMQETWV